MQNYSNDFLISLLEQFQDEELKKSIEEMDTDLIIECSNLILKLQGFEDAPLYDKDKKT